MSKLYGSLQGNRGMVTRGGSGNSGITASCQSYDGSITTKLYYNKKDELMVMVDIAEGSADMHSWSNKTIFNGSYQEYISKLKG